MKKLILLILLFVVFLNIYMGCSYNSRIKILINENQFMNEPEYELAKAVNNQNVRAIEKFCLEHPECVQRTYEDHYYSVLHWAAETGKLKSLKALLNAGMNPNVITDDDETPLHTVPYNFTVSVKSKEYIDYSNIIKILIKYGADCNYPRKVSLNGKIDRYGITPFMRHVITGHLEYANIMLQNANVDVNARMKDNITAAVYLLYDSAEYGSSIYNAEYIICKCKADITSSFVIKQQSDNYEIQWSEMYPVELLRKIIYPLDSEEYKIKLKIVEEFERQGVDYYNEPVPEEIKKQIQNLYPDTWEEYIKVY